MGVWWVCVECVCVREDRWECGGCVCVCGSNSILHSVWEGG